MHDFSYTQAEDMNYPVLADRVRYFKETDEGREIMCKAFEEVRDEGAKQKSLELIKNLIKTMNLTLDKSMDALMIPKEERISIIEILKNE